MRSTPSQPPHHVLAGVPLEVLKLARAMREPLVERRPTAEAVERHCSELARQLQGPSLREWARTCVTRGKAREPDALVGQTLSHTLPGISYEGAAAIVSDRRWTVLTLMLGAVTVSVALLVVFLGVGSLGALWFVSRPEAELHPNTDPNTDPNAIEAPRPPEPAREAPPQEAPPVQPPAPPVAQPDPPRKKVAKAQEPPLPEDLLEPQLPAPGTVSQAGADSIELVGEGGRFRVGKVPAGRYSVLALFPGEAEPVPAATIDLPAGGRIDLRCDARFKRCMSQ